MGACLRELDILRNVVPWRTIILFLAGSNRDQLLYLPNIYLVSCLTCHVIAFLCYAK